MAFVGAPVASSVLGHGPNEPFLVTRGLDAEQLPGGGRRTSGRSTEDGGLEQQLFVLGADSSLGRDEFLRILYGAQVSLEVGVGATLFSSCSGRSSAQSRGSTAAGPTP